MSICHKEFDKGYLPTDKSHDTPMCIHGSRGLCLILILYVESLEKHECKHIPLGIPVAAMTYSEGTQIVSNLTFPNTDVLGEVLLTSPCYSTASGNIDDLFTNAITQYLKLAPYFGRT